MSKFALLSGGKDICHTDDTYLSFGSDNGLKQEKTVQD